jgi:predicted AlkP superfamily pyrophosphatase or phosphodiesterase
MLNGDWNAMIMHYLGLDHIGHKTGPKGYAISRGPYVAEAFPNS